MYVVPSINISLMLSQFVHCVHDNAGLTHIWLLKPHQKLLCYAFKVKVMFIVSIEGLSKMSNMLRRTWVCYIVHEVTTEY